MKKLLAICFFLLPMLGYAEGTAQGIVDGQNQAAQNNMINAWSKCINDGGGSSCGPAPQVNQQPQPPVRTDFRCLSDCTAKGYQYQLCQSRCSY